MTLTVALAALAQSLDDVFEEAVTLLPQMINNYRAGATLPRRDPLTLDHLTDALTFTDNGERRYLTLAQLTDEGKVSYLMEEALVWIALDGATCVALEDDVGDVKPKRSFFDRRRDRSTSEQDDSALRPRALILMQKNQAIAIRAAFLANFVRHSIEHIGRAEPSNVLEGSWDSAQRHLEHYQRQVERIAPSFTDKAAAADLLRSLSMPITPIIITELEDDNCERLNGIPMTKEHATRWRTYFGQVQAGRV